MKQIQYIMKPQDVVILLKIIALNTDEWQQKPLADALKISQSEISQSIVRSQYAGLMNGKKVMRMALMDFLQYGLTYTFPQKPGVIVRGMPTAHSAAPLNKLLVSSEAYVWPWAKGKVKGQSIKPLFASVPEAAEQDETLYTLLALTDALRVGKAREKEMACMLLKERLLYGK